jgi:hypothetical protein
VPHLGKLHNMPAEYGSVQEQPGASDIKLLSL